MTRSAALAVTLVAGAAAFASPVLAAPALLAHQAPLAIDTAATAWILTSTALVLLMTLPGLALFYGGMVRRKNVIATITQSVGVFAVVSLVWFIAGYSLAVLDLEGDAAAAAPEPVAAHGQPGRGSSRWLPLGRKPGLGSHPFQR